MLGDLFRRNSKRASTPVNQSRRRLASAVRVAYEPLEGRAYMSFSAPVSYPAASSPVAMITADVNNDGNPDVLTSNAGGSVTVLLGNGDATFHAPQVSPLGLVSVGSSYTGSQAGTLAAADFNNDGRIDVASVVSGTSAVIALGNGDGTFSSPHLTSLGSGPTRITTGDVNADGRTDLLVANDVGTGSVSVVLGNGDGTFAAALTYAAGPSAQDVKAADMNHDGKLDLVVADAVSAGSVSVLLGNGDGSFQPYRAYYAFSAPYRMQIEDFNNDGNPDVCVANSYTSSFVTILLGNPDGSLQPYHSYDTGSQPWELDAVDVDGDGKADLVDSNGSTYQVELNNGDGTFAPPTSMPGAGLAFAADDFNRDGVADIAGANLANVGVLINNTPAMTNVGAAVGFQVSLPPTTSAGSPLAMTLSAVDAAGNVVPDFLGTVHVTTTDPRMSGSTFTFTAADAGTHTFATGFTLYTVGTQTVTVSGPAQLTGSATVNVTGAATSRFAIAAGAATAVAGNALSFTVTTQDAFGNLSPGYTGTVHFSSTDVQAGLPADYAFTPDDHGVHTFTAVLKTAGAQVIKAADATTPATSGASASILVTPAAASSLGLVGGGGHIGSAHPAIVTAYDAFGNVATGYTGTIHLASSDPAALVSADATATNGVAVFSVTPMTLGAQTLTATDVASAALTATEATVGTPGDAATFRMSAAPGGVAGSTQNLTLTAFDAFGNVAVDYAGSVAFSSSDPQATLPFYTFNPADNGSHTFALVLRTAGAQSLTARDYFNPSIIATQSGIVVTPAPAVSVRVPALQGSVAGVAQQVTITARDAYGNVASDYRGTLAFSSSDTLAALPAAYTFTAADAGAHTFSVTFKSAGGQTFTVQDTATAAVTSFQRDIQITPAAVAGFALRAPSNVTAGVAFSVTVSAVDAFGNTITGYAGKIHFSGPSGGGNLLPADYTFTPADAGAHTFSVTLASTGTQTLSVSDLLNNALKSSTSVTVKTSTNTGGTGGGGGGGGTGGGGTGGGGKKVV